MFVRFEVWFLFLPGRCAGKALFFLLVANTSFAAYEQARQFGDSEAMTMKNWCITELGIPEASIMVEETSISSDENAKVSQILLERLARFTYYKPELKIGIVTYLYHMDEAMNDFLAYSYKGVTFSPVYTEDYLAMIPGTNGMRWITAQTLHNILEITLTDAPRAP